MTRHDVLRALSERLGAAPQEAEEGTLAAEFAEMDAASRLHRAPTPLEGFVLVEIIVQPGSPALGHCVGDVAWPTGSLVVAISEHQELVTPRPDAELHSGERIFLLAPWARDGGGGDGQENQLTVESDTGDDDSSITLEGGLA